MEIAEIKNLNTTKTHWGLFVKVHYVNWYGALKFKQYNVFKRKDDTLWRDAYTGEFFELNGSCFQAAEVLDFFVSDSKNFSND